MRVIWQSEIDPFACAVLRKHWPDVPNYGDVRTISAGRIERPDVICGGFPCQDVSLAGGGRGLEGERSGLWFEFRRIVGDFRPRFVAVENVGALTSRGLAEILGNLAAIGFDAEWHLVPAAAIGAPHLRDRCYIIAADPDPDPDRDGLRLDEQRATRRRDDVQDGGNAVAVDDGSARSIADADAKRCERLGLAEHGDKQSAPRNFPHGLGEGGRRDGPPRGVGYNATRERMEGDRPARLEIAFASTLARLLGRDDAGSFWKDGPIGPALRRVDDGVPARLDRGRLATLGNAVVPQLAEIIGRAIVERAAMTRGDA